MDNSKPGENGQKPSKDQIKDWVKGDLKAAHYFLGVLMRYPDVLDDCAEQIYEHAMKTENGSAIDHVKKD